MIMIKPESCSDVRWSSPVTVQLRYGFPEEIETPLQALNCLAQRWPKVGGVEYVRARELCMAALGGRVPSEMVRAAFVAAAEEAAILARASRTLKTRESFGSS